MTSTPAGTRPEPDEHLLEVYRQAGENARTYANSRFSNLSAFLTYVSLLTAGIAVLLASANDGPELRWLAFLASALLAAMGLIQSLLFWALEVRHHGWWEHYELRIVRGLEAKLGHTQYPATGGDPERRDWAGEGLLGLGATDATYWVYKASIAFFGTAFAGSLAMLALIR